MITWGRVMEMGGKIKMNLFHYLLEIQKSPCSRSLSSVMHDPQEIGVAMAMAIQFRRRQRSELITHQKCHLLKSYCLTISLLFSIYTRGLFMFI